MKLFLLVVICLLCICTNSLFAEEKAVAPGLVATYADGKHRIVTLVATPDFVLGDLESVHPQLGTAFTAEWNGLLKIVKRARYTLAFDGTMDAKIRVDEKDVSGKPVDLDLGDHPIQITFTRKPGSARGQLIWSADFFASEPVPPSALVHRDTPPRAALQGRIEAGQLLVEQLNCTA